MILSGAGELGFMVRTKTPGLSTQILVNDHTDGSVEKSAARDIIADGHWHLYSWQINSTHGWKNFVKGHGDNLVGSAFTLNSILVNGKSDAQLSLDDVVYQEYPDSGSITHLAYNAPSSFGGAGAAGVVAINNGSGFEQFNSGTFTVSPISVGGATFDTGGAGINLGGGLTKVGAGSLILIGNNTITGGGTLNVITNPGAINITGGGVQAGFIDGGGTLLLNNGFNTIGSSVGTIDAAGATSPIPSDFSGTIKITQAGTISTTIGSLNDYPIGAGTEISHLDNGALLLSEGTFGTGGLLLLNSGTLALSDASVAPQFADLAQSSGIAGTVLTPEPFGASFACLSSLIVLRRRRPRQLL
jgi:hypothetical protein